MKILHITASYKPAYIYGGPIMSVSMLCEGLTGLDVLRHAQDDTAHDDTIGAKVRSNVEVLTTTANGLAELNVDDGQPMLIDGVWVTYFKRWTKDHSHFSPGLLLNLNKLLRQAQHDNINLIIHIHAWWNLVSILGCLVAKWYDIPIILSPRGMLNFYTYGSGNQILKKIIHHSVGKKLLKYCTIHATTNKEKTEIVNFIKDKDISVIPNLVALQRENWKSVQRNQGDQTFKIIFLSRINPIKGLELLFDALSKIDFEFNLTIAGSGEKSYVAGLRQQAERLKLRADINWIGQVSNEEKFSIMATHDLLVLPSYNENFANVVIESLSVGTPVLVSEHVGLADYVKTNNMGWVCKLEPNDIAQKISDAYTDAVKRDSITHLAPAQIRSDFNDEFLARRYMELYEEVLRLHS